MIRPLVGGHEYVLKSIFSRAISHFNKVSSGILRLGLHNISSSLFIFKSFSSEKKLFTFKKCPVLKAFRSYLLESFPSLPIRATIRFKGSIYFVNCLYFSRYCCSSCGFNGLGTAAACPGVLMEELGDGARPMAEKKSQENRNN